MVQIFGAFFEGLLFFLFFLDTEVVLLVSLLRTMYAPIDVLDAISLDLFAFGCGERGGKSSLLSMLITVAARAPAPAVVSLTLDDVESDPFDRLGIRFPFVLDFFALGLRAGERVAVAVTPSPSSFGRVGVDGEARLSPAATAVVPLRRADCLLREGE